MNEKVRPTKATKKVHPKQKTLLTLKKSEPVVQPKRKPKRMIRALDDELDFLWRKG